MPVLSLQQLCEKALARQCWDVWGVDALSCDGRNPAHGTITDVVVYRRWAASLEALSLETCISVAERYARMHVARWCDDAMASLCADMATRIQSCVERIPHTVPFVSCHTCDEQQVDAVVSRCDVNESVFSLEQELYTMLEMTLKSQRVSNSSHATHSSFSQSSTDWRRSIQRMRVDMLHQYSQAALLEAMFLWETNRSITSTLLPLLRKFRMHSENTKTCVLAESGQDTVLFCDYCDDSLNTPTHDALFADCGTETHALSDALGAWWQSVSSRMECVGVRYRACGTHTPIPVLEHSVVNTYAHVH